MFRYEPRRANRYQWHSTLDMQTFNGWTSQLDKGGCKALFLGMVLSLLMVSGVSAQQTNIFTVFGQVFQSDGVTLAPNGTVVKVNNQNTGVEVSATVGMTEAGKYDATFVDFTNNRAAKVGDVLQLSVFSDSGRSMMCPKTYTVTADDIAAQQVRQDLTFSNGGTVSLVSSGTNVWVYRLTWVCGDVTEWRYLGAGITGASVEGTAATAGWQVDSWSSTQVVFKAGSSPLTSGSLEGFRVTGILGGIGSWQSHSRSGSVDGSLPVTLSHVEIQYLKRDGVWGNRIAWRTETEVNNLGFAIYRRRDAEADFRQIAFVPGAGNTAMPRVYEFFDTDLPEPGEYSYQIESVDFTGERHRYSAFSQRVSWSKSKAHKWRLLQNYPNPFNPETWFPYQLAEASNVRFRIYDIRGRVVRVLNLGFHQAGAYFDKSRAAYWDGKDDSGQSVSSGVYFYQLVADGFTSTRRMVVLR